MGRWSERIYVEEPPPPSSAPGTLPVRKPTPLGWVWVLSLSAAGVAGVVGVGFLASFLSPGLAAGLFFLADADHHRLVVLVVGAYALVPLGARGATRLWRTNRVVAALAWLPVALLGVALLGFIPGRGDGGRRASTLRQAVDGGRFGTGEVFVNSAIAALCVALVLVVARVLIRQGRRDRGRAAAFWVFYAAAWTVAALLVMSTVSDTAPRGSWLGATARAVAGGDDGVTGGFPHTLDTSLARVVGCDAAAEALRVGGEVPELDGCRTALLVAASGRYDRDGARVEDGRLVAVVVQVRTLDQLEDLDATLDDAEVVAAGGLPEPPGTFTTVTTVEAARSVLVAAEDSGDIPVPAEGPGALPLTRSLAYVVTGSAVGLYLAPPLGP